jgi:hypothetical protein
MRLSWKDAVATGLTGVIAAMYIGYLLDANPAFLSGTRAVAGATFALGLAACILAAQPAPGSAQKRPDTILVDILGTVALVAASTALFFGSSTALGFLVTATVLLWALSSARHAFMDQHGAAPEPPRSEMLLEQYKDELPPRLNIP